MRLSWFFLRFFFIVATPIGLLIIYATFIEPNWIETREQPVYIDNLPEAFEGFRIIQLSDLHSKRFFRPVIARRVNKFHPDLVVITGDVFDRDGETPFHYLAEVLEGVDARYGTYFVFGNNEFNMDKQQVKEALAGFGVNTLVNESVPLNLEGDVIYLVGIDDPYSMNYDLLKALKGTGSVTKILLAHTPEIIYLAEKHRIDLTLVGHTHGGQILIPFFPGLISNVSKGYEQYRSGLFAIGTTQMYVNRGLGENGIPMRFLTRPEITVITLHENP